MSATAITSADRAVMHVLDCIRRDGRLAYLMGYGSQSWELLTAARAEQLGEDVEAFRKRWWADCNPEAVRTA